MSKDNNKDNTAPFETQPLTGMPDLFPAAVAAFRRIEQTCRDVAGLYGYGEIRTPVLERLSLFKRGLGEVTDVVEKEMYSLTTAGGDVLALRPENTASVVRAWINEGLHKRKGFTRLFYIGPMFRHEKPQKNRYRQLHQFGVEALGSASPLVDVEVIALANDIYKRLGFKDISVNLYTFGDVESRNPWRDALTDYFKQHSDALSDDSKRRLERNVFRILDSKEKQDIAICETAPRLDAYLTDNARKHFDTVRAGLDALGIAYVISPKLVRGLDYYAHTIFEFFGSEQGRQSALGAGGRYDGLVEQFGGLPGAGAVGFALGLDRMALTLSDGDGFPVSDTWSPAVRVCRQDGVEISGALKIAADLRSAGIACDVELEDRKFRKQLARADKDGAKIVVIIGEAELRDRRAWVKHFATSRQAVFELSELPDVIRGLLDGSRELPAMVE